MCPVLAGHIRFVEFAHRDCGLDPDFPSNNKCRVPEYDGVEGASTWLAEMGVSREDRWWVEKTPYVVDGGGSPLAANMEIFLDTLCVHLQSYSTRDWSRFYGEPDGTPDFDNVQRKQARVDELRPALAMHGLHVTDEGEVMFAELAGTRSLSSCLCK